MLAHQRLQLADQQSVAAKRQISIDPALQRL
jgi:hypothetical protein